MAAGILAGGAALCLAACATLSTQLTPGMEPRLAVAEETRLQARILALATPLITANAPYCHRLHPFTGLVTTHIADWPAGERDEVRAAFGADPRAAVWIVAEGSPAARAGLRPGDVLLSLNGHWSEPNARWHDDFRARTFPAALRRGAARLRVQRGQEGLDLVLEPEPACAALVRLVSINLAGGRRQAVWLAGDTLFVDRAFASTAGDDRLQQYMALALARQIARHRALPGVLERALQGPDIVRFALGLDAMDWLAGRGPEHAGPRWRTPSQAEITLAALILLQAGAGGETAYVSLPGPDSPASPAASGPEGASEAGSISSIHP